MPDEAARLRNRLTEYRRAAAVMLADWHSLPVERFRARHMKLLRKLIDDDLEMMEIKGLSPRYRRGLD
jgi:hypothetical protein